MTRVRRRQDRLSPGPMFLLVLVLSALSTVAWTHLPQTEGGGVRCEVTNGTPGSSVPENLVVTLHTFSGMQETGVYTTTATDGTNFAFDGVRLEVGETAVVRTVYDEVMYVSDFATVESAEEPISLPVTIFETTESPTDVSVTQLHLFVNRLDDELQVGEYVVVGNTGDRTYVGSSDGTRRRTWSISLPEGADNLQFDGATLGDRFVETAEGFADTRSVPPGEASVETSFTYEVPAREGIDIVQSIDLPVRAVVLVLPEGEWALAGEGITSEGLLDTQMGTALSYMAGPLAANETLSLRVVPREVESAPTTQAPAGGGANELIVGLGALVVGGVAAAYVWRSASPAPMPPEVEADVRAIAALDRDYEMGTVPDEAYRRKRESLKRKIHQKLSG